MPPRAGLVSLGDATSSPGRTKTWRCRSIVSGEHGIFRINDQRMDREEIANERQARGRQLDNSGGDTLYSICRTTHLSSERGQGYARVRSVLWDRLYHFLPLYPHQGVHRSIQATKRASFYDACSGLRLWNRGVDFVDPWPGILQADLALVGVPIDFPWHHHALSRHHVFDQPPSAEAEPGSSRRVVGTRPALSTTSDLARLFGDGNAGHAGA